MSILTINSGSSSLKFAIFNEQLNSSIKGSFERISISGTQFKISDKDEVIIFKDSKNHNDCLSYLVQELNSRNIKIDGVGHRVVHGGDVFKQPIIIDEKNLEVIKGLTSLAPLHQPHNISGIEAVMKTLPNVLQVAVFDTSFHNTIPKINQMLPLPRTFYDQSIKAYGFHGLSYDYISRQPEVKQYNKVIVAHLGNGSSACALLENKSYATTMGFTAIDGLMMGTRTGSIDPGVVLHLIDQGMTSKEVSDLLYKKSGLLGISELSSDIRDLIQESKKGNLLAIDALNMFADKAAGQIAKLATLLRSLDLLVFTAGIGENASLIRKMISERLKFIGLDLDESKNDLAGNGKRLITKENSKIKSYIIPTNEEWIIAEAVKQNLSL